MQKKIYKVFGGTLGVFFVGFVFTSLLSSQSLVYNQNISPEGTPEGREEVTHIKTPDSVRAIYMTSWVAGTPSLRERLVRLIDETELNSVVIDIKDYTGKIAFTMNDPEISQYNSVEERISDMRKFIEELHKKNIYVIGRVTVFQDPHLAKVRPDFAVKRKSDGGVWKDKKGLSYTDPGKQEVWTYHAAIAKEAYSLGFDEINFDYIRFPSDGDLSDIYFPASNAVLENDTRWGRAQILENFFAHLAGEMRNARVPTSADIFGMTTVGVDDLGIGQVIEQAAPHFDFIAPMVYPSHYAKSFLGFANPAEYPYEVVHNSLVAGVARLDTLFLPPARLRPWLQDFDYGATYDAEKVRAQIQATYDAGIRSWMLWDPANVYTKEALELISETASSG